MATFYGRNHVKFSSKIHAIFFDMDNTLIQTRKADVKAVNKVTKSFKIILQLIRAGFFGNLEFNLIGVILMIL